MTELARKAMLEAFEQKAPPTNFLSQFFRRSDMWVVDTDTVEIDIVRNNEKIAIDVTPHTAGRLNVKKRWTTKEYKPPMYDEYNSYNGKEFFNRLPGNHPYTSVDAIGSLIARVTDDQTKLMETIIRAIEKMASDVFLTGKVVLVNDEEIDFKQKATHRINASAAWAGGSANIPADLEGMADVIRADGQTDMSDLIFGSGSWENFIADSSMQARFNYRRVELVDIGMPVLNTAGAAFHGIITVGSYQCRCWTYPQSYEVPTDAEIGVDSGTIPNAGSRVAYIPDDKVIGLGRNLDLRMVFAGVPVIVERPDPRLEAFGISGFPSAMAQDFQPYVLLDKKETSLLVGVKSRPLTIPTQIDGWAVLDTNP
jgi:hypothetical protein